MRKVPLGPLSDFYTITQPTNLKCIQYNTIFLLDVIDKIKLKITRTLAPTALRQVRSENRSTNFSGLRFNKKNGFAVFLYENAEVTV